MNCNFKYLFKSTDGKDVELASPTWEGLIQQLISGDPDLTPDDYFVDSLAFYNADVVSIVDSLQNQPKKNLNRKVTNFIKNTSPTCKKMGDKNSESYAADSSGAQLEVSKEASDIYVKYRDTLGIAYHECIDTLQKHSNKSKEYETAVNKLWSVIEKYKPFTSTWKSINHIPSVKNSIEFLEQIQSKEQYVNDILPRSLQKITDTLSKYGSVATELRIQEEVGDITGKIDALTWDSDGNVIIWDFKTTANSDISTATKIYRYLQLRLYKEMLIQYSKSQGQPLSYDKIQIKTLLIQDSVQNGQPDLQVKTVDPEEIFSSNKDAFDIAQKDARTLINILYPYEGKELTEEQAESKKTKIARLTSPIISELGITKLSQESQETYLLKQMEAGSKPTFLFGVESDSWKGGATVTNWVKDGDQWIGYDASKKQIVKGTLQEIAAKEVEVMSKNLKSRIKNIADGISIKSYNSIENIFKFDRTKQRALLLALEPYLSDDYEYQYIPFLEDNYNIITLKNRASGSYTFLVISDLVALDHQRKDAKNILTPVFNDQNILKKFKEAQNLPNPSAENILTLQAMSAISECADIISDEPIKLDRIQVISAYSGTHTQGSNLDRFTDAFKLLEYQSKNNPTALKDPEIYSTVNSNWRTRIQLQDDIQVLQRLILNRISTFKLTNEDAQMDTLSSITIEDICRNIDDVITGIEKEYRDSYNNIDSQIGRIYAELKKLRQSYASGEVQEKLYKHTKYGLTAAETLGAGIDLLRYAEARKYSFNGLILNGIAQGLETSVSYSNPDKTIAFYEQMFRNAARQITVELNKLAVQLNLATKKFLKESGKTALSLVVTGSTSDAYEALFEQDETGKVAKNMQLKNPYSKFSELADFQREYAEEVLWAINRLRIKSIDSEYLKMDYSEFKKSNQFNYYVELINNSPEYLEMPLKLRNSTEGLITNIRNFFDPDDDEKGVRSRVEKFCKNIADRWQQSIEPVLLTPDQISSIDQDIDEEHRNFQYHSPYNKQGENRVQMLNNTPVNEWEKNLNILTLEYACAQFKEVYFQQALHTVGNLLGEIDLMEVMTGKDLSDTKKALVDRMKISIYNRNLVDDELKTASSIIAGMKQVVSLTKLALRPATFIKEMILGVIRNSSTIITENFVNDVPITFDHLRQAAEIVYTNGLFINNGFAPNDEKFGDFRLVGALNNLYRINDRDLNLLGESLAYDSHGIMHWGSRMLYLNTTAPDWFNRMQLVVAKMIADGTWEAHSLDAIGNIIYDPFKDKRFSRFLSFYRQHKGNLSNEPADEAYVLSKAKYIFTIEQLKKEGYTDLKASDAEGYSIIPICYTEQEISSLKEQIGMLYGYYSHEERSIIQKSIAWLLHTQFLTFLPGEIKKYFASGNFESSVGRVVHATDPFSKKKLYYIQNDAGLTEIVDEDEITYDKKTQPVLEFTKTPIEGLVVSTLKTCSQVWHGDRENISEEQWNRTKLFIFNMLIWAIISALIAGSTILLAKNRKATREEKKQMDATAAGVRILRSVSQELNVFGIMESSIAQLGITGYDGTKEILSATFNNITSSSRDWLDVLNEVGAINDFQIR